MLECQSLPQWNPLPTKYTFIHFEEDIQQKAWLGRSVTCPAKLRASLVLAAPLLEDSERTAAVASAAGRLSGATRGGNSRRAPPPRAAAAWSQPRLAVVPSPPVGRSDKKSDTCPLGHALEHHRATRDGYFCDVCHQTLNLNQSLWGCRSCDYDKCEQCVKAAGIAAKAPLSSRASPVKASAQGKDVGAWSVVRSGRSTGGRRGQQSAPLVEADEAGWANVRDNMASRHRDVSANIGSRAIAGQQGKDCHKWGVKPGGIEAEDDTDATASTGPGAEEVTSGDSNSGKQQGSSATSAQPPQGDLDLDADEDAEDDQPVLDDGWTQVAAPGKKGKRDRKEPAEVASPKAALTPTSRGAPPARHEGNTAWSRPLRPATVAAPRGTARAPTDTPSVVDKSATVAHGAGVANSGTNGEDAKLEASVADPPATAAASVPADSTLPRHGSPGAEPAAPRGARTMLRFKVDIKQDDDFNLMRRLLVPGGGHIKRIAQLSNAKLKLTASGTGHPESAQREIKNNDPVFICIWSAYASSLEKARAHVETLLPKLHEDYRTFCSKRGFPMPQLTIPPGETSSW